MKGLGAPINILLAVVTLPGTPVRRQTANNSYHETRKTSSQSGRRALTSPSWALHRGTSWLMAQIFSIIGRVDFFAWNELMNGLNPICYFDSLYPRNKFLRCLPYSGTGPISTYLHFDEMIHCLLGAKDLIVSLLPIHSKSNMERVKDERF